MHFDEQHKRGNAANGERGEQGDLQGQSARPPPSEPAPPGPDMGHGLAVPPEVMVLIKRVAKYHSRIHEGLLQCKGDLELAIHFARKTPDGMTEDEEKRALATIAGSLFWDDLLDQLIDAACAEIDPFFLKPPNSDP